MGLMSTGHQHAYLPFQKLTECGFTSRDASRWFLRRGISRAVIVEASAGYAAAASDEAARRVRTTHIDLARGDFLEVTETIPTASVVTLDRVTCCYPLYEQLLSEALRHVERGFAFSDPRDRIHDEIDTPVAKA